MMTGVQTEMVAVRASVALAVPSLAAAAHGHAASTSPGSAAHASTGPTVATALLMFGVGILASLIAVPAHRPLRLTRLVAVLGAAQAGVHLLLAAGSTTGAAHLDAAPDTTMLLAHAAATVVTATLIVAAADLVSRVGATVRALCAVRVVPRRVVVTGMRRRVDDPAPSVLAGGCGVRGPPRGV